MYMIGMKTSIDYDSTAIAFICYFFDIFFTSAVTQGAHYICLTAFITVEVMKIHRLARIMLFVGINSPVTSTGDLI